MAGTAQETKKAPPRNKLEPRALLRQPPSETGLDPNFVYQWMSKDPKNPSSVIRKCQDHDIGDPNVGYMSAPAWQVVQKDVDPLVRQLSRRDDGSSGIDSVVQRGESVLCRMSKEDHDATYGVIENLRCANDGRLAVDRARETAFEAQTKTVDRVAMNGDASVAELLAQSGVK